MEKQIIPQTMHYFCLRRKSYPRVMFVGTQRIQQVTNELCHSKQRQLLTSHSWTEHRTLPSHTTGEGALPTNTHSSLGVLTPTPALHIFPSSCLFFFLSSKAQTPPQEMKDGHLVSRNTPHTQNIQTLFFFFSVSCSLARERMCLVTQSVGDPPHTAHPPLTFSVHMLTAKA